METCKKCLAMPVSQRIKRPVANRYRLYGTHYGKSCRYNYCTTHCTCTRPEKREWLNHYKDALHDCTFCDKKSPHSCLQLTNRLNSIDNRSGLVNTKVCSKHCNNLECTNTVDCHAREMKQTFTTCQKCFRFVNTRYVTISTNHSGLVMCLECLRFLACYNCNLYFVDPNQALRTHTISEISGYVTRAACGACNRCISTTPEANCCRCRVTTHCLPLHSGKPLHTHMTSYATRASRYNPLERTIGVELEIAGFLNPPPDSIVRLYNTCIKWGTAIGTDSSINCNIDKSRGVELRTAPAGGNLFLLQLREVIAALNKAHAVVNISCGIHVHVGILDILPLAIRDKCFDNILLAWECLENTFFELVAPERRSSTHCRPLLEDAYFTDFILENPRSPKIWERVANTCERYRALNVAAIGKHGTIEFRLHHGSTTASEIIPWALICCAFTNYVFTHSASELRPRLASMRLNPRGFLRRIAPTPSVLEYLNKKFAPFETHRELHADVQRTITRKRRVTTRGRRIA